MAEKAEKKSSGTVKQRENGSTVRSSGLIRAIPMSGFLMILSGFGLFLAQWKFRLFEKYLSQGSSLSLLAAAVLLFLWGAKRIGTALWWGERQSKGRQRLHRNRVMLPREGLVFLVIIAVLFVGSLLGRSNTLLLVFSMMAGPFVLNGWITFSMLKRTSISRRSPSRCMAGEPVSVAIQLENRKRWLSSWLMGVQDRIESPHESLDARVLFTRVPPGEQRSAHYQLCLMHRGRYEYRPIHLTTRFPLGLVERGLIFDVEGEIVVYPRVGELASHWKREVLTSSQLVYQRRLRPGTFDDEFHRIREYRPGDNPRAIHWRSSARRNELMVREFHQSRDENLAVFLDLWQPERPTEEDLDRVELAVSFAATVCLEYLRQSHESNLHLAANGQSLTRWEASARPASIESMLETLALVEAGPSRNLETNFREFRNDLGMNTVVLVITTRRKNQGDKEGVDSIKGIHSSLETGGQTLQLIEADPDQLSSFFRLV